MQIRPEPPILIVTVLIELSSSFPSRVAYAALLLASPIIFRLRLVVHTIRGPAGLTVTVAIPVWVPAPGTFLTVA